MGQETAYLAVAEDYLTSGNVKKARECLATARRFPGASEHTQRIAAIEARCKAQERPKADR